MINWNSIDINTLIQMAVISVTIIGLYFGMRGEMRVLGHDVQHVEEQIKQLNTAFSQLGTILTQVAVQDRRLTMMEQQLYELRHGQGFVNSAD